MDAPRRRSAYQRLWAADPAAWRAAGHAWRTLVGPVDRRRSELTGVAARLRAAWSGPAARAADRRLALPPAELAGARPAFIEIDQVLAGYSAALARARALLSAAVTMADRHGLRIDRHVRVAPGPTAPAVRAGPAVPEVAARITTALETAAVADRLAAGRLADLAVAAGTGWTAHPGGDRPPPGADPVTVRRWWDGLGAAQRRWLVAHESSLVGGLDGIPAAARDQANRLLLAEHRSALAERRTALLAGDPVPVTAPRVTRLDRLDAGLAAVADRLAAADGPRAYLLGLDPAGDGRAVISLGDPDTAERVLTYVPGMMADLPGIGGELDRADRLADQCGLLAPGTATATVLWLGYDAPDFLDEAARESSARDAAPALHRFQEGLRASHDVGPPAHHTVLGYSYGSLVAGHTARDHGLAADDLILLGSPGVGVDHASGLGLPAGRVWAGTAHDDPIQYVASPPAELLGRLAVGAATPLVGPVPLLVAQLVAGTVPLGPADELWFGRNPATPAFGAGQLPVGGGGHGGYWAPDGPALPGVARIALAGRP